MIKITSEKIWWDWIEGPETKWRDKLEIKYLNIVYIKGINKVTAVKEKPRTYILGEYYPRKNKGKIRQ